MMGKRTFRICLGVMAAVIGALIWLNVAVKKGTEPDVSFRMVNAGIVWEGAGYNGIYDR